jgi:hypothetical protein
MAQAVLPADEYMPASHGVHCPAAASVPKPASAKHAAVNSLFLSFIIFFLLFRSIVHCIREKVGE